MNWKTTTTAIGLALLASTSLARADGVLNIYNWGNYTSPDVIKKFEAKYNVKVTITDYDSNDTALAKVRQGGHGFDMIVPSQNYVPILIEEGLLLETRPDQMENFKNVEKDVAEADFDKGRHYTIPWALTTVGLGVDTAVYKGDINTWDIVFNTPDELKGKVNVVPEMNDVIDAAVLYNGGTKCTGDMEILKKVRDTLVNAKPNWIAMEYNTIDKMVSGDFAATMTWNGTVLRQRLQKESIHYGYPKEGFITQSDNLAVLKDAKNVENAKLFQNFMMDPENAAANSSFHGFATGISGTDKYLVDDMKGALELNVPEDFKKFAVASKACPPEVQELYTKIWTEVQK